MFISHWLCVFSVQCLLLQFTTTNVKSFSYGMYYKSDLKH